MKNTFLKKKYKLLFFSALLGQFSSVLFTVSDALIAGKLLGPGAISAINIVSPIYIIVAFLGNLPAMGIPILYNMAAGDFDKEKMKRLYSTGLFFALILGIGAFVISKLSIEGFLASYSLSPELTLLSKDFFKYLSIAFLFTPLTLYLGGMVYADGDDGIYNLSNLANAVGKITLSIVLGKAMGVAGLGLATLIGLVASTLVLLIHFFKKSSSLELGLYFDVKIIPSMLKYSFKDASFFLCSAVVTAFTNRIIILNYTEALVPVYAIFTAAKELGKLLYSCGLALTPLVTVYRGEKNHLGEKRVLSLSLKYALIAGVMLAIFLLVAAPLFPGMYGITDEKLVAEGLFAVRVQVFLSLALTVFLVAVAYQIVSRRIIMGTCLSMLKDMIFPVALMYPLNAIFGIKGVWLAFIFSCYLSLGVLLIINRLSKSKDLLFNIREFDTKIYTKEFTLEKDPLASTTDSSKDIVEYFSCALTDLGLQDKKTSLEQILEGLLVNINHQNNLHPVLCECSLIIGEKPRLILWDGGRIFDATEGILPEVEKEHFVTLSGNRNVFTL